MKNTNKLLKDLIADSKSDWAIKEDMADMYKQDAQDYESILTFIESDNLSGAKKLLEYMDTLPREHAIITIAEDLGNKWVLENLGWNAS